MQTATTTVRVACRKHDWTNALFEGKVPDKGGIHIEMIEHEICTHALVDRVNGSRVRVINARAQWPARAVKRSLADG